MCDITSGRVVTTSSPWHQKLWISLNENIQVATLTSREAEKIMNTFIEGELLLGFANAASTCNLWSNKKKLQPWKNLTGEKNHTTGGMISDKTFCQKKKAVWQKLKCFYIDVVFFAQKLYFNTS